MNATIGNHRKDRNVVASANHQFCLLFEFENGAKFYLRDRDSMVKKNLL
jgi:hypothetical protein